MRRSSTSQPFSKSRSQSISEFNQLKKNLNQLRFSDFKTPSQKNTVLPKEPAVMVEEWHNTVWKRTVKEAVRKKFKWTDANLENLNYVLSKTADLADNKQHFTIENEYITKQTNKLEYQVLIETGVNLSPTEPLYNEVMVFYTNLLKTFYVLFWKLPVYEKPFFSVEYCEFQDPFYRQRIRSMNSNDKFFHDEYLTENFNLKEFLMICLHKFFPYEQSLWANEKHQMHLYSLKLFLETFEYGLWTMSEIDNLNEIVYKVVQSMANFEQFVKKNHSEVGQDRETNESEQKKERENIEEQLFVLYEIKKILGEIYIHMCLMILDDHVDRSIQGLKIESNPSLFGRRVFSSNSPISREDVFKPHLLENNLFFTYFGNSIANYFFASVIIKKKVGETKLIANLLKKVIGFLGDISIDFYFHSLRTVNEHSLTFYVGENGHSFLSYAEIFQSILGILLKYIHREQQSETSIMREQIKIKTFLKKHTLEFLKILDVLQIIKTGEWTGGAELKMVKLVFKEIYTFVRKNKSNADAFVGMQTSFAMLNVPQLILHVMYSVIIFFKTKQDRTIPQKLQMTQILRRGALLLSNIVRENPLMVSLLFQENPATHLAFYAKEDPIGAVIIFSKMLLNDFGVMLAESNNDFLHFILGLYKEFLKKMCDYINSGEIKNMIKININDVVGLLLYSRLFRAFFKCKKSHSLKVNLLFMKKIVKRVLFLMNYFENKQVQNANADFFKQLDDPQINFNFWKDLERSDQIYLLEESLYQTLCCFEFSTKRFHFEDLQKVVAKVFQGTDKLRNFLPLLECSRGQRIFKAISKIYKNFLIFNRNATFYYHSLHHQGSLEAFYDNTEELEIPYIADMKDVFNRISASVTNGLSENDAFCFLEIYFPMCFKFASGFIVCAINKNINKISNETLKLLKTFLTDQIHFVKSKILNFCQTGPKRKNMSKILEIFIEELDKEKEGVFSNINYKKQTSLLKELCKEFIKKILKVYEYFDINCTEIEEISYTLLKEENKHIKEFVEKKLHFHAKHRVKSDLHGKEDFVDWKDIQEVFDKRYLVRDIFYHSSEPEKTPKGPDDIRRLNTETELLNEEAIKHNQISKDILGNNPTDTSYRYEFGQFTEKKSKTKEFEWITMFAHKYLVSRSVTKRAAFREALLLHRPDMNKKRIVLYLMQRYMNLKAHSLDNFESNRIMKALNIQDDHTPNVKSIVNFFYSQFHRIDFTFKLLENNFLVENFYFNLLMFIDYLMQNSNSFREIMFSFIAKAELERRQHGIQPDPIMIEDKNNENFGRKSFIRKSIGQADNLMELMKNPSNKFFHVSKQIIASTKHISKNQKVKIALDKLLSINNLMFVHLVRKNFVDNVWCGFYRPFYLISNFIQNLCEENFVEFKQWFNREGEHDHRNDQKNDEEENIVEKLKSKRNLEHQIDKSLKDLKANSKRSSYHPKVKDSMGKIKKSEFQDFQKKQSFGKTKSSMEPRPDSGKSRGPKTDSKTDLKLTFGRQRSLDKKAAEDDLVIRELEEKTREENIVAERTSRKRHTSYLEELYTLVEHSLLNIEVFFSKDTYLSAQDKEEMFPIFTRSIECMTEFINGGISRGADKLYFRRMNVFVGIFFRIIDDLDSTFYELKTNVIIYLTALLETKDKDTQKNHLGLPFGSDSRVKSDERIEFVARNFSVIRVWALVKELIKRVYLKKRADMSRRLCAKYKEANRLHNLSDLLAKYPIRSCDELLSFYKKYEDSFAEHQIIEVCIRLWVFMNMIAEVVPRYANFITDLKESVSKIDELSNQNNLILKQKESALVYKFLTEITIKIEISVKRSDSDKEFLEDYIFKKKPCSFFLNKETKVKFFQSFSVHSLEEKRSDFFKIFPEADLECDLLKDIYMKLPWIAKLGEYRFIKMFKIVLFLVTLILNILILIFYNNLTEDYRNPDLGNGMILVTIFSITGFSISTFAVFIWFSRNYLRLVEKGKARINQGGSRKLRFWETIQVYLVWALTTNMDFIHFSLLMVFYALGRFVSPLFFCLAMFLIADISDTIKSIILAFSKNIFKMLLGILLIVICMNVYAFLIYDQFPFYFTVFVNQRHVCDTYFKCLMNTINLGMIHDKGVAAAMEPVPLSSNPQFIGRFFFDVTFFLFITTILFQIIFGIIVDSYEEYQEEYQKKENDLANTCFVCGYKREEIEKINLSFVEHIKCHYIWNYLFYYQYLKRTPSNDYNGIDIYVSDLLNKEQMTWMPYKRTREIEQLESLRQGQAFG